MRFPLIFICGLAFSLASPAAAQFADLPTPAGVIPLFNVDGRIDHMAIDAANKRLFVAALGNNSVEVIDLKAGKQAARIEGVNKPQGVAYLPDLHRLVVASGGDGKVKVYDDALKPLGTIDGLDDADNVRYDAAAKFVYVGYGDGALAVIDAKAIQKVADVKLAGHPESFQLETSGDRIFVNVPDAGHVAVVDRTKREVIAKWPVERAAANFPMALDEKGRRLFVGCRKPAKLLALDLDTGKTVEAMDCAGDADDVFFDAARGRVYVSGGEGRLSVFGRTNEGPLKPLGAIATAPGARTSFFSAADQMIYVAAPRREGRKAELLPFSTARHDR